MYQPKHYLSAERIAFALDRGRRVRADEFKACCPAHDDRSPSLSISQRSDRVLLKCWSGCRQGEIIDALRVRGLWPKERERRLDPFKPKFSREELEYYHLCCLVYRDNVRAGWAPSKQEDRKFRVFSRICYRQGVVHGLV